MPTQKEYPLLFTRLTFYARSPLPPHPVLPRSVRHAIAEQPRQTRYLQLLPHIAHIPLLAIDQISCNTLCKTHLPHHQLTPADLEKPHDPPISVATTPSLCRFVDSTANTNAPKVEAIKPTNDSTTRHHHSPPSLATITVTHNHHRHAHFAVVSLSLLPRNNNKAATRLQSISNQQSAISNRQSATSHHDESTTPSPPPIDDT